MAKSSSRGNKNENIVAQKILYVVLGIVVIIILSILYIFYLPNI